MDASELLGQRASISKLTDPAPAPEVLDRMLRAALRAPDHGALRPWKILIIQGAGREKLGEVMADVERRQRPDLSDDDLARARGKALRAPLVAIVAAAVKKGGKIPEIEQVLSAGCVAYGLELAAQAEGFGAIWKTGELAYDRIAHEALGFGPDDRIVAVLYIGTPKEPAPSVPRPSPQDHVRRWP